MEQFNLQDYLKNPGRKIVTRDGRNVRILCTDRNHPTRPIVALVQIDRCKDTYSSYTKDGLWFDCTSSPNDLFFAPEKKEGWINLYKSGNNFFACDVRVYNTKEEAKNCPHGSDYIATVKIEWEE